MTETVETDKFIGNHYRSNVFAGRRDNGDVVISGYSDDSPGTSWPPEDVIRLTSAQFEDLVRAMEEV